MRVLIACEFSGIVRDAFLERGHDAMICIENPIVLELFAIVWALLAICYELNEIRKKL